MSKDYQVLIDNNFKELDDLKAAMEKLKEQFIIYAGVFIGQWYNSTTRNYVKRNADRSLELGKEKLEDLKHKVNKLEEKASEVTKECLSAPEIWWHVKEDMDLYYEFRSNSPPEFLSKALRPALGRLGPVLDEFGYVNVKTEGLREHPVWCEWDAPDDKSVIEGRACYPYGVEWSSSMIDTMKKYQTLHRQAIKVNERIEELKKEKVKQDADKLWDSV